MPPSGPQGGIEILAHRSSEGLRDETLLMELKLFGGAVLHVLVLLCNPLPGWSTALKLEPKHVALTARVKGRLADAHVVCAGGLPAGVEAVGCKPCAGVDMCLPLGCSCELEYRPQLACRARRGGEPRFGDGARESRERARERV
jgi:hypothetical protein